jgi:carbonic anhydrase
LQKFKVWKEEKMKDSYNKLIEGNRKWVKERLKSNATYFVEMSKGQVPEYLWIGCSDSRVSPNEITGTGQGEIFVHRNIANMIVHCDMNILSVLQFSVEFLKVKHVIVCGHYGCGGVLAAMNNEQFGLIGYWIYPIKKLYHEYQEEFEKLGDIEEKSNLLVDLNTREEVHYLSRTSIIQDAWKTSNFPKLHAWVYDIKTGMIKILERDI